MPKKGQTNNPNGRPKGKPNKATKELREALKAIVDKEFKGLPKLLQQLEPKDRTQALIKLLSFILPKPVEQEPETGTSKKIGAGGEGLAEFDRILGLQ